VNVFVSVFSHCVEGRENAIESGFSLFI